MAIVIETQNLQKSFGKKVVLQDIDVQIHSGTIFGFLGPNGAGKTTTIRLLNGLLMPTGGTITVLGQPIPNESAAVRQHVGVQTDTNVYESLTAEQNLVLWGEFFGLSSSQAKKRTKELLEQFGLAERAKEPVSNFSKGMKQKVLIARALIHEPKILYLDEPTAGLDPEASEDILNFLGHYVTQDDHTVFLSSHRLEEVQRLCTQIALIDKGKIKIQGAVSELLEAQFPDHQITLHFKKITSNIEKTLSTLSPQVYNESVTITLDDRELVPALVHRLVSEGAQIYSIQEKLPTLTDLYLKVMPKTQHGLVKN